MNALERWCLPRAEALDAREWADEVVVYDADAASTHLLNPLAGGAFMALWQTSLRAPGMSTALTLAELFRVVFGVADVASDAFETAPGDDDLAAMSHVMGELERIGLARRVIP